MTRFVDCAAGGLGTSTLMELVLADPRPLLQLGVGVVLALLGAIVLAANPRKAPHVTFAAFCFLVALNYVFGYLVAITSQDFPRELFPTWPYTLRALHWASLATVFNVFDPLALLFFTAYYPQRNRLAHPAVLGAATLVVTILALHNFVDPLSMINASAWSRALVAWYSGVYAFCLLWLLTASAHADVASIRARQLRLVTLGLGVAVLTRIAIAHRELSWASPEFIALSPFALPLVEVGLLGVGWLACRAYIRALPATPAHGELVQTWRIAGTCVGAVAALWLAKPTLLTLASATGIREPFTTIGEVAWLSAYGVRWLIFAGIVAYALLRFQVFDLDLRLKRAFLVGASLIVAALAFTAIYYGSAALLDARFTTQISVAKIAAVLVAVVLLVAAARFMRRAADKLFPGVTRGDAEYLRARKLEVYRAALEPFAAADSASDTSLKDLAALRQRLGVTDVEHDALLTALRASVAPRRAPGLARPGDVVLGRYRLVALVGTGATGRTFVANDLIDARDVAVKEILSDSRDGERAALSALREAKSVAEVRHPNVLAVHSAERAGETFYVVMDYARGGTLKERLARARRFDPVTAVRVARDLLEGLAAVHAHGIVHRDVKPANVLFDADGRAMVGDFGVAHVPDLTETLTSAADRFQPGTPFYMAPEQIEGRAIDAAADVYAAAVILYEMLAGRSYLDLAGLDLHAVRDRIVNAHPDLPLANASAELNAALARGLAKAPEDRHASARAFADALAATPEGQGRLAPPRPPPSMN